MADSGSVDLEFEGLSFSVEQKKSKEYTCILQPSIGRFSGGRLTAIMGASGAGKTTLLNLVSELAVKSNATVQAEIGSGRIVDGHVQVVGTGSKAENAETRAIGYVEQDDLILPTMSVREVTLMAAKLRLPTDMPLANKMSRVDDVLSVLGLDAVADARIGDPTKKGISGGERKRTSIAMALVTDPDILLLDEPTSGLDSLTAFSVVKVLQKLAHERGKTMVATIHQPNSDIFQLFDDLCLLHHGRIVYHGPVADVIPYFASVGFECPHYNNPADYLFMTVLNDKLQAAPAGPVDADSDPEGGIATAKDSGSQYAEKMSQLWRQKRPTLQLMPSSDSDNFTEKCNSDNDERTGLLQPRRGLVNASNIAPAPFLTQFGYLFQRAFQNVLRNPMLSRVRLAQACFVGLLLGLIYLKVDERPYDTQVQDRQGALFFLALNCLMMNTFGILTVFAEEKVVFLREYRNGYYSLPAYFLSKMLVELPFYLFFPAIQGLIAYAMIFGESTEKGAIFVLITIVISNVGVALGVTTASIFEEVKVAQAVVPMLLLPLIIFSGLFINNSTLPPYFTWIKWISPVKFGFAAYIENAYNGWTYELSPGVIVKGEDLVRRGGFDEGGSWGIAENTSILVAFYFVLMIAAYVCLWTSTRRRISRLM